MMLYMETSCIEDFTQNYKLKKFKINYKGEEFQNAVVIATAGTNK